MKGQLTLLAEQPGGAPTPPADDWRWRPTWHACRYSKCGGPVTAVTENGLPLCDEHHDIVAEHHPILRPRRLADVGQAARAERGAA